jgi:aminopeptidase N
VERLGNLILQQWLNEGFAEFMEYKGTDAIEPNWNMLDSFIPADLVRALRADESTFTHAIALPVSDPNEISSIFDDISYGKGSSVIRL